MLSKKMAMIVLLILLIFISMIVLSLSSRRSYSTHGPGRVAIALVAPFQKIIIHVADAFKDIWQNYFYLIQVVDDNKRLRKELAHFRAIVRQHEEVAQENKRLRRLLVMGESMKPALVAALVVGKDPTPWFQTILVDKGRADGVQVGLPVVNPDGIVGLTVEATNHFAKVMLITDPNSAVDAIVQKTRARGIIKGGSSGYCGLHYALSKHDISVGDVIISSGMDGVFPKGLLIGEVKSVVKPKAAIFQDVIVTPYVDFERLEEVSIVLETQSAPLS
jgi:rod shape-determining protein MreC